MTMRSEKEIRMMIKEIENDMRFFKKYSEQWCTKGIIKDALRWVLNDD